MPAGTGAGGGGVDGRGHTLCVCVGGGGGVAVVEGIGGLKGRHKLQALVYDIFPSTTAVFSYAIGSRKLSANEQFFVGAQTVVSLLQTTQIISDVCFITDHVAQPCLRDPE